jgi:hypothetical protein
MTRVSLIVLAAAGLAFGCRSTESPPTSAFRLADGKLLLLDEGGRVRMRLAPLPAR